MEVVIKNRNQTDRHTMNQTARQRGVQLHGFDNGQTEQQNAAK